MAPPSKNTSDPEDIFVETDDERVIRALKRQPAFRHVHRRSVHRLVAAGKLVTAQAGATIQGSGKVLIVLDGLIRSKLLGGPISTHQLHQHGAVVGLEAALVGAKQSDGELSAATDATYFEIKQTHVRALLSASTPFRQGCLPYIDLLMSARYGNAEVIAFEGRLPDLSPSALSALIERIGREMATSFPDRVLVVRPDGEDAPPHEPQADASAPRLWRATVAPADVERLRESGDYDYVLLDGMPGVTPNLRVELRRGLPGRCPPVPPEQTDVLEVLLPDRTEPSILPLEGINIYQGMEDGLHYVPADLDLPSLGRTTPGAAGARTTEAVARIARAVTERRVGLALGGGGVWAMAFVYILQQLQERGVPVDMITATSGGALVSGYYAVGGLPALKQLVKDAVCGSLELSSLLAGISSAATACFCRKDMGNVQIQNMTGTQFHPVATDLTDGTGIAFTQGAVAEAIRASGSYPFIMSSTWVGSQQYVDGSFSSIVPTQVLPMLGADLTFAGNCFPAGMVRPWPVPQCLRVLNSIVNPVDRWWDMVAASVQLFHDSGIVGGAFAAVACNSDCTMASPQLIAPLWFFAPIVIEAAKRDPDINEAIDRFCCLWEKLKGRSSAPHWVSSEAQPSAAPPPRVEA